MDYLRRVIDNELDELFPYVGAIAIDGPRAVGKTETARGRATTEFALDDGAVLATLAADPGRITRARPPVLIDEWQRMPETFDLIRRAVDAAPGAGGRYLLTGSAAPSNPPTHSGAGRIISLRMRPMTLVERGFEMPTVSLADLLAGARPPLEGDTAVTLEAYTSEILASGFPGLRGLPERAVRAQLDGYLERIIDRDLPDTAGASVRNQTALRGWLAAYACAEGSTTSYEKIRDAATPGHAEKPARSTVSSWHDTLARLWIADPVPAWSPRRNDLARLASAPKHHLADPALAARLRGVGFGALLDGEPAGPLGPRDGTLLGALFESLAVQSARVFAQAAEARVLHHRDQNGRHEVDLIVERADRRVVAIEVKLSRTINDADVSHLQWLQAKLGADLLDAIVISTGPSAYRRSDGIGVVPLALLGP